MSGQIEYRDTEEKTLLPDGTIFEPDAYNSLSILNIENQEQIGILLTHIDQLHFDLNGKRITFSKHDLGFVLKVINAYRKDEYENLLIDNIARERGVNIESLRIIVSRLNSKIKSHLDINQNLFISMNGTFRINPKIRLFYIQTFSRL